MTRNASIIELLQAAVLPPSLVPTGRLVFVLLYLLARAPEVARWQAIKATFRDNLRNSQAGQVAQVLGQLEAIAGGLSGSREALKGG